MSWQQKVLRLAKLYGPAAKFAAKAVLGVVLPGSPAVVQLVEQALDCAHETAKEMWEIDERLVPAASEADLRRLEEVLGVLDSELPALMAQMARLEAVPDLALRVLNTAVATDDRVQSALYKLTTLAMRFDRLEEQNRRLLEGQGYAAGMLEELLPLVRQVAGVADFVAELKVLGFGPVGRPLTRRRCHLMTGGARQRLPDPLGQPPGQAHEVRLGVQAEDEAHALGVPAVQVVGLGEVGVAPEENVPEADLAAQGGGAVEVRRRPLVAGTAGRAVDDEQWLVGVRQRHDQGGSPRRRCTTSPCPPCTPLSCPPACRPPL